MLANLLIQSFYWVGMFFVRQYLALIYKFLNKLIPQKYRNFVMDHYKNIQIQMSKLLRLSLFNLIVLSICYIFSFYLWVAIYNFGIPEMIYKSQFNLTRFSKIGYLSQYISLNEYSYNMCKQESQEFLIIDEDFSLNKSQICQNSSLQAIQLSSEDYNVKVKLIVPDLDFNYNVQTFEVILYVVDDLNEVHKLEKLSSIFHEDKRYSFIIYIEKLLKFLRIFSSNLEIEVNFNEIIPNKHIKVKGIILHIPRPKLILLDGSIEFKVSLYGIRYFIHEWFLTMMVIIVHFCAWSIFLSFLFVYSIYLYYPIIFRYFKRKQ